MSYYFTFNGIRSDDIGIHIVSKSTFNSPARDITFESVPGRNGDLVLDNGRYENVKVMYECAIYTSVRGELQYILDHIKNWLYAPSVYSELTDNYSTDVYRKAVFIEGLDVSDELNHIAKFTVTFSCKPYRYLISGKNTRTFTTFPTSINNPMPYGSLPYIKVTGSGDITLTIGNYMVTLTSIDEYIEIDSELQSAYKGTTLQNTLISSYPFPSLIPGVNSIAVSGTVTRLEIIPRWVII